jgi:hypothetical protein
MFQVFTFFSRSICLLHVCPFLHILNWYPSLHLSKWLFRNTDVSLSYIMFVCARTCVFLTYTKGVDICKHPLVSFVTPQCFWDLCMLCFENLAHNYWIPNSPGCVSISICLPHTYPSDGPTGCFQLPMTPQNVAWIFICLLTSTAKWLCVWNCSKVIFSGLASGFPEHRTSYISTIYGIMNFL